MVLSSSETLSSFDPYSSSQFPSSGYSTNSLYPQQEDSSSLGLHYVESSAALAPITTKIRSSTALTEKIILEITKSIKVFKPSRSLYHLTNDQNEGERDQTRPTASIDVVISGKADDISSLNLTGNTILL